MHRRWSPRLPLSRPGVCGLIAAAAWTALPAAAARADTIYLRDGRVLRGTVEANGEKFWKVTFSLGKATIKRADVLKLKGGPAARTAYDEKMAGATPENGAAWIALGQWCEEHGLDKRARKAYQAAIGADPTALEPLQRLSALAVDDLVYRYLQAAEDDRGPILAQLRPHADRGIDGIRRAFEERMQLARDHVAGTQAGNLAARARKEFKSARRVIWRRVIEAAGASYERHDKNSKVAHEIAYYAGRVIALAKRTNLRDAIKSDPFIDRHLAAADALAAALRDVAEDSGKAQAEVQKLVKSLTDQLAKADLTSDVKPDPAIAAYNATVRAHNKPWKDKLTALEWQGIESVNWYREILGLRMLKIEPHLMKAARGHSADMVRLHFFAHFSPVKGHREPWDRACRAGYVPKTVGENLAQQIGAPLDGWGAMRAWIISPPHHRNMLKPYYVHIGIGVEKSHWTLNLGVPLRGR